MYISSWFEYHCNLRILLMPSLNQISEIETSHEVSKTHEFLKALSLEGTYFLWIQTSL